MNTFVFPDNTVLINFTLIDRQDILQWFLRGRGKWTIAIARECAQSSDHPGLSAMRHWSAHLGRPLEPTKAELLNAAIIAESMRKPGDSKRTSNLGEAETIAVIAGRGIFAVFLTDDHGAARRASLEPGISTASTTRILALAEVNGKITRDEAREFFATLTTANRVLGSPSSISDYATHVARLRARRSGS